MGVVVMAIVVVKSAGFLFYLTLELYRLANRMLYCSGVGYCDGNLRCRSVCEG